MRRNNHLSEIIDNTFGSYTYSTERSQDVENKSLDFSGALWFNFGMGERVANGERVSFGHPTEVWFDIPYDVKELPQRVVYFKKRGVQDGIDLNTPPLYPLPIKKAKAEDLHKLVSSYVPAEYQEFYAELHAF